MSACACVCACACTCACARACEKQQKQEPKYRRSDANRRKRPLVESQGSEIICRESDLSKMDLTKVVPGGLMNSVSKEAEMNYICQNGFPSPDALMLCWDSDKKVLCIWEHLSVMDLHSVQVTYHNMALSTCVVLLFQS